MFEIKLNTDKHNLMVKRSMREYVSTLMLGLSLFLCDNDDN